MSRPNESEPPQTELADEEFKEFRRLHYEEKSKLINAMESLPSNKHIANLKLGDVGRTDYANGTSSKTSASLFASKLQPVRESRADAGWHGHLDVEDSKTKGATEPKA